MRAMWEAFWTFFSPFSRRVSLLEERVSRLEQAMVSSPGVAVTAFEMLGQSDEL